MSLLWWISGVDLDKRTYYLSIMRGAGEEMLVSTAGQSVTCIFKVNSSALLDPLVFWKGFYSKMNKGCRSGPGSAQDLPELGPFTEGPSINCRMGSRGSSSPVILCFSELPHSGSGPESLSS